MSLVSAAAGDGGGGGTLALLRLLIVPASPEAVPPVGTQTPGLGPYTLDEAQDPVPVRQYYFPLCFCACVSDTSVCPQCCGSFSKATLASGGPVTATPLSSGFYKFVFDLEVADALILRL